MQIKIGALAKLAGCPVVTIRFYEKEGLLGAPERNKANYRLYSAEDVEQLRFILHCRKHGISLADIKLLLAYRKKPNSDCTFVHKLIKDRLEYVEEQIASLNQLRQELIRLNETDADGHRDNCPIIGRLDSPDDCLYCKNVECGIKR